MPAMAPSAQAPVENRARGMAWMLATMFCFIALDAIMKHLLETCSLVEVTWGRFFFASIFAALACGRRLGQLVKSRAPRLQLARSVLLMSTTGAFNSGIRLTPLATGTTIMFLSPLLVTLLSIPLLGEKVGLRRWTGIATGFLGALIVVRPFDDGLGIGAGVLFLMLASLLNAGYQLLTRQVRQDDPLTSLFYTAAAGAVVTSIALPWFWTTPGIMDGLLLAASGLMGALGHLCLIRAFRAAPASVVAPFSYSSLIWATLFGFAIWGDWPDTWTWIGAALIIGSGLYVFHRERKLKGQAV